MLQRLAPPKPARGTAKREKARLKRQEAAHAKAIRAACVERDGYCVIQTRIHGAVAVLLGPCEGPSEWAHVAEHRRCHTRGMEPQERHTTAGSGMLCKKHHDAYDAHAFDFLTYTFDGMNGEISVIRRAA